VLCLLRGVPRARHHDSEPVRRLQEGGVLRQGVSEGALEGAQGAVQEVETKKEISSQCDSQGFVRLSLIWCVSLIGVLHDNRPLPYRGTNFQVSQNESNRIVLTLTAFVT
jgi:hypothetical protein